MRWQDNVLSLHEADVRRDEVGVRWIDDLQAFGLPGDVRPYCVIVGVWAFHYNRYLTDVPGGRPTTLVYGNLDGQELKIRLSTS